MPATAPVSHSAAIAAARLHRAREEQSKVRSRGEERGGREGHGERERSEGHAPLVARVAEGRLLDGVKVTEVLAPPTAAAGARLLGPGGEGGA